MNMKLSNKTYYPWVVITLSALFLFYKYILQVSPSVMTNRLMAFFHVSGSGLGNLAASFFYAYLVTQLFVGPLLDKYSPRLLTGFAILLSACGAFLFSQSHTLIEAELSRALIGVGAAFATVSYMKMTALWFKPSQFAFIGGLLATAGMVGALFGEAPLTYMVSRHGWQNTIFYCSIIGIVIAILFLVIVRDKKSVASGALPSPRFKDFIEILKRKSNWLLTFYSGLAFAPLAVFGGLWGNPFLQEAYHLSHLSSAGLISLVFLGFAFGGPIFGLLAKRLKKMLILMAAGTLLSFLAIISVLYVTAQPMWLLGCCLFLLGFGTGSFMLGFAMGKDLNRPMLAASVIALINTGDAIFGAFSEPLTGKALDVFWDGKIVDGVRHFSVHDYHISLAILPFYLIIALVFLWRLGRSVNKTDKIPPVVK